MIMKESKNSSNFRIVEHKDYFTIEKKHLVNTYFTFGVFLLWKNGLKTVWNTIGRNGLQVGVYAENYQFNTKEECLEWIANYENYPIYHYL